MASPPASKYRPLLLLSSRPWNSALAARLSRRLERRVESITAPSQLTPTAVASIDPQWIFVPHWSHLIPESIWGSLPTMIFHMTALPYGSNCTMQTALRSGKSRDRFKAFVGFKRPAAFVGCH